MLRDDKFPSKKLQHDRCPTYLEVKIEPGINDECIQNKIKSGELSMPEKDDESCTTLSNHHFSIMAVDDIYPKYMDKKLEPGSSDYHNKIKSEELSISEEEDKGCRIFSDPYLVKVKHDICPTYSEIKIECEDKELETKQLSIS